MQGITIIVLMIVIPFFLGACLSNKKEMLTVVFEPENTSTMKTVNVSTLVSDSGVTRYRATADLWLIYDKATEPYWYFPQGLYIEQFDTLLNVKAMIKADTAWYYEKQDLWKGVGNVEIKNLEGDYIFSTVVYLNQKTHKIYSDQFTLIKRDGKTIRSQSGFESNEALSYYHLRNSSAELPFVELSDSVSVGVSSGNFAD
jgi:LPS export ABC transporter protein LptC